MVVGGVEAGLGAAKIDEYEKWIERGMESHENRSELGLGVPAKERGIKYT